MFGCCGIVLLFVRTNKINSVFEWLATHSLYQHNCAQQCKGHDKEVCILGVLCQTYSQHVKVLTPTFD